YDRRVLARLGIERLLLRVLLLLLLLERRHLAVVGALVRRRATAACERQQHVGVGVDAVIVALPNAHELVQGQAAIVVRIGAGEILGLNQRRRALGRRQHAVPIDVGAIEHVGHANIELLMIDGAVVVGVGLAERDAR